MRTRPGPRTRPAVRSVAAVAVAAALLGACGDRGPEDATDPGAAGVPPVAAEPTELSGGVAPATVALADAVAAPDLVAATDLIGLDLLGLAEPGTTTVVSPASMAVALGMLGEGASGDAVTELEVLLGSAWEDRRRAYAALRGSLAPLDGDPAVLADGELPPEPLLHLAGQVAVQDGVAVPQDYLDRVAATFDSGVARGDLGSEEGIDALLGSWIREHTGGLIEESAIEPSAGTILVVQDALTLGARWEHPLLAGPDTLDFTLPTGGTVPVEAMGDTVPARVLAPDAGWVGVRLPYQGGRLVADVLVPPEGTDPTRVDPDALAGAVEALGTSRTVQARLALPTLDLSARTDAAEWLGARAPALVSGSGLDGLGGGQVSQVQQQVVLDMAGEGTIAAAVTEVAVVMSGPPAPDVELTVARPYLVRIADTETGLTLVLAAVNDPRPSS